MYKRKTYCVAGFFFGVRIEEELLKEMNNLRPFEEHRRSTPEDEGMLLFNLEQISSLAQLQTEPIYCSQNGADAPEIAIWNTPKGYFFRLRPLPGSPVAARLYANKEFTEASLFLTGEDNVFGLNNALMLLLAFASARKGGLVMHASAIICNEKGYLFLGKAGTGKSTHARLWVENIPKAELLNDDNPIIRVMLNGSIRVFGSPWSGKNPCYKAKDVPVVATVRLEQAPENSIWELSPLEAYASVMSSASAFRPFTELTDGWHNSLKAVFAQVPCYYLRCRPDAAAVKLCYNVTRMDTLELPNELFMKEVAALLDEGREVILTPKGNSMLPFIIGQRDSIILRKKKDVCIGDIVLARISDKYILHRIIRIEGENITLMGDGNLYITESCTRADVLGTVCAIQRDGKNRTPGNGKVWMALCPVRRFLLGIYKRMAL